MDEVKKYRKRIERRYKDRRGSGRRRAQYKPPPFWTPGVIWQFVVLIMMGLWMALSSD